MYGIWTENVGLWRKSRRFFGAYYLSKRNSIFNIFLDHNSITMTKNVVKNFTVN